jgi:hypothetical protein
MAHLVIPPHRRRAHRCVFGTAVHLTLRAHRVSASHGCLQFARRFVAHKPVHSPRVGLPASACTDSIGTEACTRFTWSMDAPPPWSSPLLPSSMEEEEEEEEEEEGASTYAEPCTGGREPGR